ncbi:ECF transporter S component [Clostridium sp. WILCCON 0269]|uniref:ECF transporter S component n=1 Tax=Candidatus Clostridium eludens TaxID=3381663 RepID=A0ABW8SNB5_9CLOT
MERQLKTRSKFNIRQIAVIGMLSAISIVLGLTGLGFIPIPPVKATIMHVPVIIGAILEGPVVGVMVGLIFGIFSIIQSITAPTPVSFAFINPLVSVLPRVLIGLVSYYLYRAISKNRKIIPMGIAAAVGSLVNTVGVLGMIYLIYLGPYAKALNISVSAAKKGILAVAFTNGIPEMILSVLITVSVITAVTKVRHN